jgi:hypothetical protein
MRLSKLKIIFIFLIVIVFYSSNAQIYKLMEVTEFQDLKEINVDSLMNLNWGEKTVIISYKRNSGFKASIIISILNDDGLINHKSFDFNFERTTKINSDSSFKLLSTRYYNVLSSSKFETDIVNGLIIINSDNRIVFYSPDDSLDDFLESDENIYIYSKKFWLSFFREINELQKSIYKKKKKIKESDY